MLPARACCVLAIATAMTGVASSAPGDTGQPSTPKVVRAPADEALHKRLWAIVPSATDDGATIIVPAQGTDGARGRPNLSFAVWNRRKFLRSVIVQTVFQCRHSTDLDSEQCTPAEDAEVLRQERKAAKFVDALTLRPLIALVRDPNSIGDKRALYMTTEGQPPVLTVELSATGTLSIHPQGQAVIRRSDHSWRTEPSAADKRRFARSTRDGDACFNPGWIGDAWIDLARRIAVVEIRFRGNDTCWEDGPDHTVVTW